jgi:hypothetical protein
MRTIRSNRLGVFFCVLAVFLAILPSQARGASKTKRTSTKEAVPPPKKAASGAIKTQAGTPITEFTPVTRVDPKRCGMLAYLSWRSKEQVPEFEGIRVKFLDDGRDTPVKPVTSFVTSGNPVVQTAIGANCKSVWIGVYDEGPARITEFQIDPPKELRSFNTPGFPLSLELSPDGTQMAWAESKYSGALKVADYIVTKNLITGVESRLEGNAFVLNPVGFTADSAQLFIEARKVKPGSVFQSERLHRLNLKTNELTIETLNLPPESAPVVFNSPVRMDTLGTIIQFQYGNAGNRSECVISNCAATLLNKPLHDADFRVSETEYFRNFSEPIPNGATMSDGALPQHIYNCGTGSYEDCIKNPVVVAPGRQILRSVR